MAQFVKATPANPEEASEDPWVRKTRQLPQPDLHSCLCFFHAASKPAEGHTQKLLKKILKIYVLVK